jgi:hypothetical protein
MKSAVKSLAIIGGVNDKMRSLRIELSPSTASRKSKRPIVDKAMDNIFPQGHRQLRINVKSTKE